MIVVGNPENRRVEMFCAAVRRLDLPQPQVISYEAILTGKIDLARLSVPGCLVRIDSPGENEAVHRSLIAGAAVSLDGIPENYEADEPPEFGRIDHPRLWYRGFCSLLGQLEQASAQQPVTWMNHPADIRLLFDKPACQQFLQTKGIPVPQVLGQVRSYDDLRRGCKRQG